MSLKVVWRKGVAQLHGTVADQRVRKSIRTRNPEVAEGMRAETEARLIKASLYGAENEATFADACVLYFEAGKSRRYTAPLVRVLGKRRLASIKPGDLTALALKLYPKAKAATRNRSVLKPARAIINFAHQRGLCPPIRVQRFREPQLPDRPAGDRPWIDAFMTAAPERRLRVLALFMFITAARIGECMKLEPEHLDLDNKLVNGPPGKNGDPCVYYLTDELVHELRLLEPRRTHYGRGPLKVFGWADKQGVVKAWRANCVRAGILYLTPHEAGRHGFATELIVRQQIDPATAAKLGRWRDKALMLNRYAHARGLAAAAEAALGSKATTFTGTPVAHGKQEVRIIA
jgi:integrase